MARKFLPSWAFPTPNHQLDHLLHSCHLKFNKVGDLRFVPPIPSDPFEDEFAALGPIPVCAQKNSAGRISGEEDCLVINVWTLETDELLPVIVS